MAERRARCLCARRNINVSLYTMLPPHSMQSHAYDILIFTHCAAISPEQNPSVKQRPPPPGCGGRAPHCVAANVLLTHVVHLLGHPLGLQHPKRCVLSLRFSCPQHILEQVPAAGPGGDGKQHMLSLACRRAEARGRCNGDREQQLVPHSAHTTSARCVDSGTPLPGSERSWPGE